MSKNKTNKPKQVTEQLQLMKFFHIQLKDKKELNKLKGDKLRQYLFRLQKWSQLMETQLDFEKYKTKALIDYNNALVNQTQQMIDSIKTDPQFEHDFEIRCGQLIQIEDQIKQCAKGLQVDKQKFLQLYCDQEKNFKQEADNSDHGQLDTNPSNSFKKVIKKGMKRKTKEEFKDQSDRKPSIKKEFKIEVKQVKDEYDSDIDIKPEIKTEIKTEIKQEILTSDEEEYC